MDSDKRAWAITFSDMLTLLLTFFVFIISISEFKSTRYREFWGEQDAREEKKQQPATSFKLELIKGLKLPVLNPEAEQLLTEIGESFENSSFEGVDVYYDENKISLMVSEQLSFEGGKFDLQEEMKQLLLKLIEPVNNSKFNVSIEGHSDSLKNPGIDNTELSLNRALSVARFLIRNGVDKTKLSVSGYGPYRPIASNDTLDGRKRNRRVEVNIIINND
jgi:chemotaxis protein MotB